MQKWVLLDQFQPQAITKDDPCYPQKMLSYAKAPDVLYVQGNLDILNMPTVAVVGTRDPSELGKYMAYKIAKYFAQAGIVVASGLARGCDTEAHWGAVDAELPTIAILGTPLWKIYPAENYELAKRILETGGALITEYTDNVYAPRRFFERDHLQAAISNGVIPVQAGADSGTLHTCRSALTQNRHLIVPKPVEKDLATYPEKYTGILEMLNQSKSFMLHNKESYEQALEMLKK